MWAKPAVAAVLGFAQLWNPFAPPPTPSRAEVHDCLSAADASVSRIRSDAIFFCGRINAAAVAAIRAHMLPTDTTLLIASFGGDLDAPIVLGELVRDRALDVEVVGPCLSGCASFVFVAGRRRMVAPGGVFGLHNTASSALELARALGALSADDRPLELRAQREEELYRSLGVSPALLLEPQVRLETLCVELGPADRRTGETRFLIHSRYSLWAPTRRQWRRHGVEFTGVAPASLGQAQRLLDGASSGVNVTMSELPLRATPQAYLADVGRCESDDG